MNTALELIKASPVFHIATVDGTKARVRPFGFIMKRTINCISVLIKPRMFISS